MWQRWSGRRCVRQTCGSQGEWQGRGRCGPDVVGQAGTWQGGRRRLCLRRLSEACVIFEDMSESVSREDLDGAVLPAGISVVGVPAVGVPVELARVVDWLAGLPVASGDVERVDRIAGLERLRGAVAAAQARETAEFAVSQVAAQAAAGVPRRRRGGGIAEQVGFARGMSPAAAARQVVFAEALTGDIPAVRGLLRRGEISEWSAQIVARETAGLPRVVRRGIAQDLAPDLVGMGPRQVEAAARRLSYQADPRVVMGRARTARSDRRVGVRAAPDTMAVLSAFLPAEQGIAAWVSLDRYARAVRAAGDPRTIGQVMADALVQRLTGQATAAAVPVEIGVVMTDDTLLGHDDRTPAELHGYGPIPADLALDLIGNTVPTTDATPIVTTADTGPAAPVVRAADAVPAADVVPAARTAGAAPAADTGPAAPAVTAGMARSGRAGSDEGAAAVWVRRLYTDPVDDTITHIDTRRRRFDGHLARLIKYRDQTCRDPFCTAPIRHLDHTHPHHDNGPTTAHNGAGLCERGNHTKDLPGWTRRVTTPNPTTPATPDQAKPDAAAPDPANRDRRHVIEITTPTGHTYTSTPPPALGPGSNHHQLRHRAALRRLETIRLHQLITALPPPNNTPTDTPTATPTKSPGDPPTESPGDPRTSAPGNRPTQRFRAPRPDDPP